MMSTHEGAAAHALAGVTAAAPEPFAHGWRFVERVEPDGTVTVEQEPLTAEEALHPQEGDQVTESTVHDLWRGYLRDVFRTQVAGDPTIAVLSNVRVEWGPVEIPPFGPDVAVMTGVRQQQEWRTFDIAREGAQPALIVEITSPSTATADRSTKLEAYERAGVTMYVIVDAVGQRGRPHVRLVGFQLADGGYDVAQPDQRGWLWLAPALVWLGIEDGRPRCYDEAGRPIPDYLEQAARIAALEAELRRARGDHGPSPA